MDKMKMNHVNQKNIVKEVHILGERKIEAGHVTERTERKNHVINVLEKNQDHHRPNRKNRHVIDLKSHLIESQKLGLFIKINF